MKIKMNRQTEKKMKCYQAGRQRKSKQAQKTIYQKS